MSTIQDTLSQWILNIAAYLSKNEVPPAQYYAMFIQEPEFAKYLVDFIEQLDEHEPEAKHAHFSAAIFAMDVYLSQVQIAIEAHNKMAEKTLQQLMNYLAQVISHSQHSLSFWLPVLNAFYEVHIELSPELKDAYLNLIDEEEPYSPDDNSDKLNAIRDLIQELSDLSVFDIAENFFAQSYAMPPEFFSDLVLDLYSIEEGHEIALLALLHPNAENRAQVLATIDIIIDKIELSPIALSRLQIIKNWYPEPLQDTIQGWIKIQRKKGVVFAPNASQAKIRLQASEVDGGGAQGLFIHIQETRKNRLCSLLFKQNIGIKDSWMTPIVSAAEIQRYYRESFDETVTLRAVDVEYLTLITNHFLAITLEQGKMPSLQLLEIQEEIGLHFVPQKIDVQQLHDELAVLIHPFTPQVMQDSFARSKQWTKNKPFTESWYLENADVDKLVNRCCSYVDGIKVCRVEEAMDLVFQESMEAHREQWLFHFLWVALWTKARAKKNEKIWQDSFMIAHAIYTHKPLNTIPIMQDICYQSVINSVETMQERRTHLNQE